MREDHGGETDMAVSDCAALLLFPGSRDASFQAQSVLHDGKYCESALTYHVLSRTLSSHHLTCRALDPSATVAIFRHCRQYRERIGLAPPPGDIAKLVSTYAVSRIAMGQCIQVIWEAGWAE